MNAPRRRTKTRTRPRSPKSLTLLDVLQVVRRIAKSDAEAAATLSYMLRSGSVRFVDANARAA